MVEPEKTATARQQLVKHVLVAMDLRERNIHGNDFLKDKKDRSLKAVTYTRFSRS
jgi:hypothetical protein